MALNIAALRDTLRRFAVELMQLTEPQTAISLDEGPGAKTHVLIDWENVQPDENACRQMVPEATDVWIFRGRTQKGVVGHYASFGGRATEVPITRPGKNALDFHLSFYMGYIASKQPEARFVVISNDKGYGPMLAHAKDLGFAVSQSAVAKVAKATKVAKSRGGRKAAATKKASIVVVAPAAEPATKVTKKAAVRSPAKKAPAKKAVAPAKSPAPSRSRRTKTFDEVVAILGKSDLARRPAKRKRLLSQIASLVGGDVDAAEATIDRLVAEGHVAIDGKGTVAYPM